MVETVIITGIQNIMPHLMTAKILISTIGAGNLSSEVSQITKKKILTKLTKNIGLKQFTTSDTSSTLFS